MRKNYIVNILAFLLLVPVIITSCKEKAGSSAHAGHNELVIDSSITLLAKPANKQVIATIPAITASSGTRIASVQVNGVIAYDTRKQTTLSSRVSGRIEKLLVKYNFQPVRKGQLIMEIYSPDLAAAQRELIFVAQNSPDMLPGAKQRLLLLGMSAGQVEQVLRTGKVLYRVPVYSNTNGYILEQAALTTAITTSNVPAMAQSTPSGGGMEGMGGSGAVGSNNISLPTPATTPVMIREGQYVSAGQTVFTIYEATNLVAEFAFPPAVVPWIKKGQRLLFFPAGNKNALEAVQIGLIEPVFRNGRQFLMARAYLSKNNLQPGQLLTGIIPVVYSHGWWVPKEAVWRLGNKATVFKKQGNIYTPVTVETGVEADGFVQILTDIGNWQIASNAAYLIDSESFIKTSGKTKQ